MLVRLTVQGCLARAQDLTALADREASYDLILLYEDLAREWRRIARVIDASGRSPRARPTVIRPGA
jgi:hypothetical protein